ncbi:MAG: FAD/NAD(P)-binding oxidoreductase, partial [Thiogranum sp.]|nr:FAD/NAD(P)-binding oxidoreductase [Thiogranum sp.]
MAHIVILGASTGGLPAAYDARDALGSEHEITVINLSDHFSFVPSNPWVGVGWRSRKDTSFPLEPYLSKKGIKFIAQRCTEIKADENRLVLADAETIPYDYLIIATGPELAFDEVEGMGPDVGFTQSVCTLEHAEKAYDRWQAFINEPGPVVVGGGVYRDSSRGGDSGCDGYAQDRLHDRVSGYPVLSQASRAGTQQYRRHKKTRADIVRP